MFHLQIKHCLFPIPIPLPAIGQPTQSHPKSTPSVEPMLRCWAGRDTQTCRIIFDSTIRRNQDLHRLLGCLCILWRCRRKYFNIKKCNHLRVRMSLDSYFYILNMFSKPQQQNMFFFNFEKSFEFPVCVQFEFSNQLKMNDAISDCDHEMKCFRWVWWCLFQALLLI